ncbi:hypothetical protein EJ06DRAFT_532202 [Trichodelitschia bisporula]|uniref:Glucosidase 2 subunit beta n=1 Tax=Trichodelitschia bisporula TaxID=703511 RepID=A0A6G1HRB0_9PEZI|nr:hypothetical protein EJ06DRAFT_532202 [Trichodelitschia bisporula]
MKTPHLAALLLATPILSTTPPRPRGVGPEFAKHYSSPDTFTCIQAPHITLPRSRVNDDYCDCPDGSDEPGTAACASLAASDAGALALPGFYCKNKGHQPSYIPFTYVNDGVCDNEACCDGSDEDATRSGVVCEDRCKAAGKAWRAQAEARAKALNAAQKRRKELVAQAWRLRQEVEDRIQTLTTQIQGAEMHVRDLEGELEATERRERARVVAKPKEGGKMGVLVGLARRRTEELRSALEGLRGQRDEAARRVHELEALLARFKEEYNPNFNDEGVKRAVRAWEDYDAQGRYQEPEGATERDLDEVSKADEESGLKWAEWEREEVSDTDVLYHFEAYLPRPVRDWLDTKLRDLRLWAMDNGILAADSGSSGSGSESKAVTEARTRLDTARGELNTHTTSLAQHREDLTKDYGPQDVFRALKDTCISADSGEYEYEVCWMGQTIQKPKKGGAHTGLGSFTGFERVAVDEEVRSDGRGLGSGERLAMKFENGAHCWNGPARSALVVLACAERDEIWRVVEAEKCVYRFEMGTPAVCEEKGIGGADAMGQKKRDEL